MLKPNSTVTANLIKARELIADEKNWCQDTVFSDDGSMCALGALWKVVSSDSFFEMSEYRLLRGASVREFSRSTAAVNDELDHAAVMRVYDKAIELSLQEA